MHFFGSTTMVFCVEGTEVIKNHKLFSVYSFPPISLGFETLGCENNHLEGFCHSIPSGKPFQISTSQPWNLFHGIEIRPRQTHTQKRGLSPLGKNPKISSSFEKETNQLQIPKTIASAIAIINHYSNSIGTRFQHIPN